MIQTYVEETAYKARSKGFSATFFEGQSRTGEPYPLNQIEITGDDFGSDVRVIVGPQVTQVYFSISDIPSIDEVENILDNLDQVEQILNEVVIFAPNEMAKYDMETKRPVMSLPMLKIQNMLNKEVNRALDMLNELVFREISHANVSWAKGNFVPPKRLESLLGGLIKIERGLIQRAKEAGSDKAEKYELQLNEMIWQSKRFEAELASAKSRADIRKLIEKYSSKLFSFSDS